MRYGGDTNGYYGGLSPYSNYSLASPTLTGAVTATSATGIVSVLKASGTAVVAPANDTNENILVTITVPSLAAGDLIELDWRVTGTNNVNVKTIRARLGGIGGTAFCSRDLGNNQGMIFATRIWNNGATNAQVGGTTGLTDPGATLIIAPTLTTTATIDTSASTTLVLTVQKATGTDTVTITNYRALLIKAV